ncbi:hypothetical protein B0G84_8295 [Paraburkholderia sp. BL8N3]|nr:hypothetical protein [Paraburkholderia sp. BL8N3]TCK32490.1 hypothetical protein B0G84_8295 [Paraburkholderia sp. BL8N3]
MQDFAYLFRDSVAAWLQGRGDARFQRYERHYRADLVMAPSHQPFDLETSNRRYAERCRHSPSGLVAVLDSKAFKQLSMFMVLLWGGSLLLPTVGKSQPIAAGALLCALFVGLRVRNWRGRGKRR